ncbi:hypothetical protein BC629DRAFT_705681 [Irpex lacteus]|nr:hypothetical protein BC629DRAFT_705681 [Irpex lacteus]
MLDFRLPAEDQDPDTWRSFLHRLSEADPVFLNYEANWPVYFYFNEWRQDTRRHRKRDALVSQTCRDGVHSTKRARNATQKSVSQATPIIHYHSGTDDIEQCPAMTSTSIDQTARPDTNYSSTSTQSQVQVPPMCTAIQIQPSFISYCKPSPADRRLSPSVRAKRCPRSEFSARPCVLPSVAF